MSLHLPNKPHFLNLHLRICELPQGSGSHPLLYPEHLGPDIVLFLPGIFPFSPYWPLSSEFKCLQISQFNLLSHCRDYDIACLPPSPNLLRESSACSLYSNLLINSPAPSLPSTLTTPLTVLSSNFHYLLCKVQKSSLRPYLVFLMQLTLPSFWNISPLGF